MTSVAASPDTKVTIVSQEGDCPWEQTSKGLKITVARKQKVRLLKAPVDPKAKAASSDEQKLMWGPHWPVAVKITKARPAASNPPAAK